MDADAIGIDERRDAVSTGSVAVDVITGYGGFPRGRISEISGWEQSGKTTLAISACAIAQRNGLYPAYFDVERALDLSYAERIGFDYRDETKGLMAAPGKAEDVMRGIEQVCLAGADIVFCDSVAALVTEKELEGDLGDMPAPAIRARLLSAAMPRLAALVQRSHTALVFINQFRSRLTGGFNTGPTEGTSGGAALRYFASMRISLKQTKKSAQTRKTVDLMGQERDVPVASMHEADIIKSKVASPYRKVNFMIRFDEQLSVYGIDNLLTIIEIGKAQQIVATKGSWSEFESIKANGDAAFYQQLRENPDVLVRLRTEVLAKVAALSGGEPSA